MTSKLQGEFIWGLCKRNEFQSTNSLLKLLRSLPGYQHQHDFMTLNPQEPYRAV